MNIKNNINAIIESINSLDNKEDLVAFHKGMQGIYDAFDKRQREINTACAKALCVGDKVNVFHALENKNIAHGRVTKINRKNVIVLDDLGNRWNVPASMCTNVISDTPMEVEWRGVA